MSTFVGIPQILKSAMGCHGNHAFSHSSYQNCLRTPSFRIKGVPINNLAPMKNCPGDAR